MAARSEDAYRDLMLASFADLANQAAIGELGVSLVVGGGWMTGQLIGARAWFEGLARRLEQAGAAEGFADVIRRVGATVYPSESELEAAGEALEAVHPSFLHLRDAVLIGADGRAVPGEGGYVRVRIDQVAAWMLGRIGPAGYQPPPPA